MPSARSRVYEPVASLFPLDLSGDVVALRACVDAGTQEGIYCVAAIAFGYDRAVKANREWARLMKGRTFHMTDLNARENDFKGISNEEVHEIMVGTVAIIRKYASFGVAVSCEARLVAESLPVVAAKHPDLQNMLAAFRSTYGLVCHFAMIGLGTRVNEGGPGRQISYVFERGDKGQLGLKKFLEFLGDEPHHQPYLDGYSLNRVTLADKEEIEGIFHSSDLVAWEWARHVDRHTKGLPIRRSLDALVDQAPTISDSFGLTLSAPRPRFAFRHLSSQRVAAMSAFFRDNLEATNAEESLAAYNRYRDVFPERPRR